jgi:hypothetical protein
VSGADRRFARDARGRLLFVPLHLGGRRGCVVGDPDTEARLRRQLSVACAAEATATIALALAALAAGVPWPWLLLLAPLVVAARVAVEVWLTRELERVPAPPGAGAPSLREHALRSDPSRLARLALASVALALLSLGELLAGGHPSLGAVGLALAALATLFFLALLAIRARSR